MSSNQQQTIIHNGNQQKTIIHPPAVTQQMAIETVIIPRKIPRHKAARGVREETIHSFDLSEPHDTQFPPKAFDNTIVSQAALKRLHLPVEETRFLSIGGGIGSFAWADHLAIYGVPIKDIAAIGFEAEPHGRYKRLCENSQIPGHERLRSDSGSRPDNIWGWPGYAVSEFCLDVVNGNVGHAAQLFWQVFNEPVFSEPFTPRAGLVYESIEREAKRIQWEKIWRYGKVRAIRKTDDGRYAVAYSQSTKNQRIHKIMVADYLHVAVGYSGFRFLPDLQAYRLKTQDFEHVVNAYEDHNHVYRKLRENGGTVIVRGRGIVASRILQKLYETRQNNPNIAIIHLMRSPKSGGAAYKGKKRLVENHFEQQPYNFPKSAFGGELRFILENAAPDERKELIGIWGGTTTAVRKDWRDMISKGLAEGWYQIRFGKVKEVERGEDGRLVTVIEAKGLVNEHNQLAADYIIDATGLDADLSHNPLLKDLIDTYHLPLNSVGRLTVNTHFELPELQNGDGRVYMAGAATLGGPFAPVDSFVGLQFAALQSVNHLARHKPARVRRMNPIKSTAQWLRWFRGARP